MHELSLCRNLLDIINENLVGKEIHCIKKVTLEIGELAAIEESSLRLGFEMVTKGTLAEGAILDIISIEGQAICQACQACVKLKRYYDACSHCGQFALTVIQGEAMRIQSMEVE